MERKSLFTLKRGTVVFGLLVLTLVWVGNIFYYQSHQLPKPIFLNHYYDTQSWGETNYLELYYLTNSNEQEGKYIYRVDIPGVDYAYIEGAFPHQQFTHYVVMKMMIRIESEIEEKVEFNEITVHFSDGKSEQVGIGNIRYSPNIYENPLPTDYRSSGSSSDLTGFEMFNVSEEVQLVDLQIPYYDSLLEDYLQVTLEKNSESMNKQELPILFEKGDHVKLSYAIQFVDDKNAWDVYNIDASMLFETEEELNYQALKNINYTPYFDEKTVRTLQKERSD